MTEKPLKQLCDELHEAVEKLPPSIKATDNNGHKWRSYNNGVTFVQLKQALNEFVDTRPRWRRWADRVRGK